MTAKVNVNLPYGKFQKQLIVGGRQSYSWSNNKSSSRLLSTLIANCWGGMALWPPFPMPMNLDTKINNIIIDLILIGALRQIYFIGFIGRGK